MAAVSASISTLENQLADPSFYEKNPASFAKTIAALDKERQTLSAMEEEWLELEMLREELEG
jgi:ATP-binding cassette subfamily F protein uup